MREYLWGSLVVRILSSERIFLPLAVLMLVSTLFCCRISRETLTRQARNCPNLPSCRSQSEKMSWQSSGDGDRIIVDRLHYSRASQSTASSIPLTATVPVLTGKEESRAKSDQRG